MKKKLLSFFMGVLLIIQLFCNVCYAEENPGYKIQVQSQQIYADDTFDIDIVIENNPGVISLRFSITYDSDKMQLVGYTDNQLLNGFTAPSSTLSSPYTLRWADSLSTVSNTANGCVATLRFKALATGTAQISISHGEARNANGQKVSFANTADTIIVSEKPVSVTSIALDKTTATVAEGNTVTLTPVFTPETATNKNVTWTTSDASVATVENGVVTGVRKGTATITVRTEDGNCTASCVVCVEQAVAYKMPFTDVKKDDFFYDSVMWAVMNQITCGIDETHFGSDISCTRAQMVTFLWRAAGSPEPTKAVCPFTDVKRGEYYYKAVLWAVEKEITKGTSVTTFSPNATCTRGQTVTFLYRFAGQPTVSAKNIFTDVKSGEYYYDAVLWAIKNGITKGTGKTTFAPNDICTRAQIVTFLYRDLAKQP